MCDEEIEDELHIFFRCAVARDSWSAAGLSSVLHNATYQQTNAMDRIFAVCSNESSDTVGRVAMLLWCIWQNRNDKLWNDNVQMSRQIGRHAFDAWNDWTSMGLCFRDNSSHFMAAPLGMLICIRQSGSPRRLPRSEIRKQRFFPRGDGDGGKTSPGGNSGLYSGSTEAPLTIFFD
ncbi:hypothetical protein TSUD_00260 [Trifolium subterraneum]|nr:hypothetical protein TSUD_00260 [Trifolium subterraneum]